MRGCRLTSFWKRQSSPKISAARLSAILAADWCNESRVRCAYRESVRRHRARLAVLLHVHAHEPLGEHRYRELGLGRCGLGLLAPLDAVNDYGRLLSGLVGREVAVQSKRDSLRSGEASRLHHVDLAPGGVDAHPEPWEVTVPEQGILIGDYRASTVRLVMRSALRRGIGSASLWLSGETVSGTRNCRVLSDRGRDGPVSSAPPSRRNRMDSEFFGRRTGPANP